MTYRTFYVGHGKDEFVVDLIEQSRFRGAVDTVADKLCAWTGHHFCMVYGRVAQWAWASEKRLLRVTVTKDQAKELAPGVFDYLDEDD